MEKYFISTTKENSDIIKKDLGSIKNGMTALIDFYKSCGPEHKELIKTAAKLIEQRDININASINATKLKNVLLFINDIKPPTGFSKTERKDIYMLYEKWTLNKNINAIGKIELYRILRPMKNVTEGRSSSCNYFKIYGEVDLF